MNRVRVLLLTAFITLVVVGSVVYVQSVSRMVLYTEADQLFPSAVHVAEIEIPTYSGRQNYPVNCSFRFDNPSKVAITLRAFTFQIAIDTGASGNPYDRERLNSETIGIASESLGDAGPRIEPGGSVTRLFPLSVPDYNSYRLNHLDLAGNYTVVVYDVVVAYGYTGTTLLRQAWLGLIQLEVQPVD